MGGVEVSDIEKRARDLLDLHADPSVAPVEGGGAWVVVREQDALSAIIAALTPPEGCVLVPVEPTQEMRDAMESMKAPHALLRTGVFLPEFRERYAAMLAARPDHIAHDRKMVSSSPDHSEYSIDMVATRPEAK